MPFRAKMKRAFGGGSTTEYDPSNPLTHTISKKSKKDYPENVYKPGEAMPRPKYRGPYNQAHQDKLSAFSFGGAWKGRKDSTDSRHSTAEVSDYSPMGSRLPSRGPSRRGSAWSAMNGKGGKRFWGMGSRKNSAIAYDDSSQPNGKGAPSVEENREGDDDVANVGLSRQHTAEGKPPRGAFDDEDVEMSGLETQKTATNGYANGGDRLEPLDTQRTVTNGQLFSADELANAMSQSTLRASRRERQ